MIADGALPDELEKRYYSEMVRIWLDAPEQARIGETVHVELRGEGGAIGLTSSICLVFSEGFRSDDVGVSSVRSVTWMVPSLLLQADSPSYPPSRRETEFSATEPGDVRVTARVFVLILRPGARVNEWVDLSKTGEPIVPPGVALWSGWLEVEATIRIEP